jgi:hypothetical protein
LSKAIFTWQDGQPSHACSSIPAENNEVESCKGIRAGVAQKQNYTVQSIWLSGNDINKHNVCIAHICILAATYTWKGHTATSSRQPDFIILAASPTSL